MKIIKVNTSETNAYKSIKSSMKNVMELTINSNLDACGCTGNGNC